MNMNKHLKIFNDLIGLMFHSPGTATQDKAVNQARFYGGPSAGLAARSNVYSTVKFKNYLFNLDLPYGDSVCQRQQVDGIFTRTTPVSDADYAGMPIGSLCLFQTIASTVVTNAAWFVKNIDDWVPFLTGGGDNIIDAIATTARASSAWHGLRVKSKVPTGVTCAGQQNGLYIETEVTGTGTCSGVHSGLKIETYIVATATMSSDHYGIAVYTYSDVAGNQAIDTLRLEHNGASVAQSFLNLQSAAAKMRYLIVSSTVDESTWVGISTTPTCATAAGWYKVKHGGYTRYIQLYSQVS